MVLRTAKRGQYGGQQFWGCSTFPKCWAVIGIKGQEIAADEHVEAAPAQAGASAQARFERGRKERAERVREAWPLLVGITVIGMVMAFLLVGGLTDEPGLGAAAAAVVAGGFLLLYFERPQALDAWRIGAEGERKTHRYLAGLEQSGFVIHNDRKGPGYGGNIDHIAIGPTGVWVIETKSYRGEVVVSGERLEVNEQPRDRIVDQVYREAVAVQIGLGDRLSSLGLTVTPVLCLHRAKLGWFEKTARGVRIVDGRGLVKLLRQGDGRLSETQVQAIAEELDRLFPPLLNN